MSCAKYDRSTCTEYFRTQEEKYRCCRLLNIIQHIDIYGKQKSITSEQPTRRYSLEQTPITTISASSPRGNNANVMSDATPKNYSSILNRLSVTTKVSGLYPGHDILSKRNRQRLNRAPDNVKRILGNFVPR